MLAQLLSHWRSINLADILTAAYIIFLVLFVIGCNHLFTNFVDAKPEGRKTVLGQLICGISIKRICTRPYDNSGSCIICALCLNPVCHFWVIHHMILFFLSHENFSKGERGNQQNICNGDSRRIFSCHTQVNI